MKNFNQQIKRNFTSYLTGDKQNAAMADIRLNCLQLAEAITALCPDGREKSVALTHLEEVMFWSNAAIARPNE